MCERYATTQCFHDRGTIVLQNWHLDITFCCCPYERLKIQGPYMTPSLTTSYWVRSTLFVHFFWISFVPCRHKNRSTMSSACAAQNVRFHIEGSWVRIQREAISHVTSFSTRYVAQFSLPSLFAEKRLEREQFTSTWRKRQWHCLIRA